MGTGVDVASVKRADPAGLPEWHFAISGRTLARKGGPVLEQTQEVFLPAVLHRCRCWWHLH
jgi:hypothetical protein